MKEIFFISDSGSEGGAVYQAAVSAARKQQAEIKSLEWHTIDVPIVLKFWAMLKRSDLVIAHVVRGTNNIFYEIGLAHGLGKPVIVVAHKNIDFPVDLMSQVLINYEDHEDDLEKLVFHIAELIDDFFKRRKRPEGFLGPRGITKVSKVSDTSVDITVEDLICLPEGPSRGRALEQWFLRLAANIKEWNVITSEETYKRPDFDLVVWNSLLDVELTQLGNPVPIELIGADRLRFDRLRDYVHNAKRKGLRSLVICTTAKSEAQSRRFVQRAYTHENFILVLLDYADLSEVKSSKDLIDKIKSKLRALLYG